MDSLQWANTVATDELVKKARKQYRILLRHKERYLKAFLAKTGCEPDECEMVYYQHPYTGETIVKFRKRTI